MTKISIIIPCYNAEGTIEKCASSLFAQTIGMEGLELIFVNDASTDSTGEKLLGFEERYPNQVMVVNLEENKKQGAARNIGISYATGKYVGFLDADDYVEPDMYEKLYQAAEAFCCDMAGGGHINETVLADGTATLQAVKDTLVREHAVAVNSNEERKSLILLGTNTHFGARIYRLKMIREKQLYFPEGTFYEDNYWQSVVNLEVGSYYIFEKPFYHYVNRSGSSSNHVTEENILQSMQVQILLMREYEKRGLTGCFRLELLAKFLKSYCVMNLLGAYLEWGEIPENIYGRMYAELKQYGFDEYDNPYLWVCDCGLLRELFSVKRSGWERRLCMQQYADLLGEGRIGQWHEVFKEGSEAARCRELWLKYKEQCFLAGLHAGHLQQEGTFNGKVEELLRQANEIGFVEDGTAFLEQMIARKGEFGARYRKCCPILVYRGDDTCYSVLDSFADAFICALRRAGKEVEVYDIGKRGAEGLLELIGRTYQAIVGFQTYLFSVHLQDGRNVHDCIDGPKFHFIFDHPLWMKEHLEQGPKEFYVFTHGRDYQEFVGRYFGKQVKRCYLLPPAGRLPAHEGAIWERERRLDVTFVGTWYDYRERLLFIKNTKTRERYLANRFLLIMKKNPNLCAEQAFAQALADYGIELNDEDFKNVLFDLKQVCFAIMTYYREKVMRTLLEEGLTIHVYGESWKKSPLSKYDGLICHPQVSVEESMEVWQDSKISLNIMSWHKGGFTERIANMLLCGTVAVSDKSGYLTKNFADGEELVLFDLREGKALAGRIKELLADEHKRRQIAKRGCEKSRRFHTWERRTEEFLEILGELQEEKIDEC